jgi:putative protease
MMRKELRREDIELLAPAGNWDCLRAAAANGADAAYFGVEHFNARARAHNFRTEELPEIMAFLRRYGMKGYLTFNILIFEDELESAKRLVEACADAGVDAVIVQDLGLVRMIREISPDLPIHGSTQMTITSPEAVEFAASLGIERVVLGRENNLKQIRTIAARTDVPLEVFVHGALCVSYSGQCLTSEMWGGRSANRGECAQACRLPYDLMVDGVQKPMGDVAYLLSPKDLAAIGLVPDLIEAGVISFKIEGRLKSPEYVANVTSKYRAAIDRYFARDKAEPSKEEIRELQQSFSRGFTPGFLLGTNNKQLVEGTFPKSRGVYLGRVERVTRNGVVCRLEAPLKRGDGIVFDAGDPEKPEEGGRVWDIRLMNGAAVEGEAPEGGTYEIVPGRNDVDLRRVHPGDRIWKTSDPALDRRLRQTFETDKPYRVFPVRVSVSGRAGEPLRTVWTDIRAGVSVAVDSAIPLDVAQKRPMDRSLLTEQLGRLGGTIFRLEELEVGLDGPVILPVSELNRLRREAAAKLERERMKPRPYAKRSIDPYADVRQAAPFGGEPGLTALCRSMEQVEAAFAAGIGLVYADFEFIRQYPEAVEAARRAGKRIALAAPRIHMPGENGYHNMILKLRPDAVLVRNTGALQFYLRKREELEAAGEAESFPELIGDFSLNIANHKAANLMLDLGLKRVTLSYDLNAQQMADLLRRMDGSRAEIVIHQHLPMFHTEHCVYCTFLSDGTDYTNCGRPCEKHRVSLRDRIGMSHPVRVDDGCRNTVYNAIEQSGAEYLRSFIELGAGTFRIEFLEEPAEKVEEVVRLYTDAIRGRIGGTEVWRTLKAINQLGVTRGQLVK